MAEPRKHTEGLVYGVEDRPAQHITPITFVGGTGRSGTHVVAKFLGRHKRLTAIGVECRFHVEDRGFPGLLDGSVTKDEFLKRMRGFWWRGRMGGRDRGLFRFVPEDRFEEAVAKFDASFDPAAPEPACRELFLDLLWPRAIEKQASGLIEQSCDTIAAAPTLLRLFPEAKFVHVIRDGRDSSASRVSQTRGRVYPRTRMQGLRWYEKRMRRIEEGARHIPEDRLMQVSLEAILTPPRFEDARSVTRFIGVRFGRRMRRYFFAQMDHHNANTARWKQGISERRQRKIERRYVEVIESFEADGVSSAPIIRATYERRLEAAATPPLSQGEGAGDSAPALESGSVESG
jgi:hypothetical protein